MKNANNIILSYLNTNSVINMFGDMKDIGKIAIAIISKAKVNHPFLTGPFCIQGYFIPNRFDKNAKNGSLLVYAKDNL